MKDFFVCCPFHEGDNTPSLSILTQDKGSLKAGFSHCFGCGWSGSYKQVEERLGHSLPLPPEIRSQLENNRRLSTKSTRTLRTRTERMAPSQAVNKGEVPFKFSPYLQSRGIGRVVQSFNRVYESDLLYMPFFNPQGQLIGTIQRGLGKKFYKVDGSIKFPIGIEEVQPDDFVYITEGQIDKMSLEEAGFRAVALGSVSNFRLVRFIKNYNICLAFDNDSAGQKATEITYNYVKRYRCPNIYALALPKEVKDINEFLTDLYNQHEPTQILTDWVRANTRRL